LVGLRLSSTHLKGLAGVRIPATVSIPELGIGHTGEVLFTEYGVSGIPVFDLSAGASRSLRTGMPMHLVINILPGTPGQVFERVSQRFALLKHKSSLDALIGLLPKQLGPALLKDADFSSLHKPAGEVTDQELTSLASLLHSWRFAIVDHNGWVHAQATAGGVELSQVSPHDLQSKISPGLYFAGELLDVHGDCGGYNLMWAWSSGMLAGRMSALDETLIINH
jgi:predicted Rossmann fold flavoprotein